jgi:hypothetical protein
MKQLFFNFLSWVVNALVSLIELANKIPFVNINTSGVTKLANSLKAMGKTESSKYISADQIASAQGGVDKFLGTGDYYNAPSSTPAPQSTQLAPQVNVFLDSEPVAAKIVSKSNNVTRSGVTGSW